MDSFCHCCTMIHHPTRLQAVREALVLAVVIAAVAAAVVFIRQRPADIDELTISIEALRSQVAELALMNDQAGDKLPPRFVTAQATQLANAVDKTRDELQQMHPKRELQPVQ